MSIYTRKGDVGTTLLYGNVRVEKNDPSIEFYGNIDELSASLGIVRAEGLPPQFETIILRVQQELITFCTEITSDPAKTDSVKIAPSHIRQLEIEIDGIESALPPLRQFVIPGENRVSATLHLSRTVCRRAERSLVALFHTRDKKPLLIAYLNRLSDLLFVMARKVCE